MTFTIYKISQVYFMQGGVIVVMIHQWLRIIIILSWISAYSLPLSGYKIEKLYIWPNNTNKPFRLQ